MKFDCYSDPQHAWLKVTRKKLISLGIEDKISSYSYQRKDHVYLEEDCDAATFILAMNTIGKIVEFRSHSTNRSSRIRSYDGFLPTTPKKQVVERTGKTAFVDGVKVFVGDWVGF